MVFLFLETKLIKAITMIYIDFPSVTSSPGTLHFPRAGNAPGDNCIYCFFQTKLILENLHLCLIGTINREYFFFPKKCYISHRIEIMECIKEYA